MFKNIQHQQQGHVFDNTNSDVAVSLLTESYGSRKLQRHMLMQQLSRGSSTQTLSLAWKSLMTNVTFAKSVKESNAKNVWDNKAVSLHLVQNGTWVP